MVASFDCSRTEGQRSWSLSLLSSGSGTAVTKATLLHLPERREQRVTVVTSLHWSRRERPTAWSLFRFWEKDCLCIWIVHRSNTTNGRGLPPPFEKEKGCGVFGAFEKDRDTMRPIIAASIPIWYFSIFEKEWKEQTGNTCFETKPNYYWKKKQKRKAQEETQ